MEKWGEDMSNTIRRRQILDTLQRSTEPCTGTELSELLGVTRQIIVADIAILRASGEEIIATPQGYILNQYKDPSRCKCTVVSKHSSDPADIEDELYTIVDMGGSVVDVTVEHPVYGQLTGLLHIESRLEVKRFIERLRESKAEPLLVLTEGLHLHAIEAKDEETLQLIIEKLRDKGYLIAG